MSDSAFVAGEYVGNKVSKKAGGPTRVKATEKNGTVYAEDLKTGAKFELGRETFDRKYKKA